MPNINYTDYSKYTDQRLIDASLKELEEWKKISSEKDQEKIENFKKAILAESLPNEAQREVARKAQNANLMQRSQLLIPKTASTVLAVDKFPVFGAIAAGTSALIKSIFSPIDYFTRGLIAFWGLRLLWKNKAATEQRNARLAAGAFNVFGSFTYVALAVSLAVLGSAAAFGLVVAAPVLLVGIALSGWLNELNNQRVATRNLNIQNRKKTIQQDENRLNEIENQLKDKTLDNTKLSQLQHEASYLQIQIQRNHNAVQNLSIERTAQRRRSFSGFLMVAGYLVAALALAFPPTAIALGAIGTALVLGAAVIEGVSAGRDWYRRKQLDQINAKAVSFENHPPELKTDEPNNSSERITDTDSPRATKIVSESHSNYHPTNNEAKIITEMAHSTHSNAIEMAKSVEKTSADLLNTTPSPTQPIVSEKIPRTESDLKSNLNDSKNDSFHP